MSCSVGAFNAAYHTKIGVCHREMGIKKGGKLVIMAGAEALFPPAEVKEKDGIDLHFVNTSKMENSAAELREMTGGTGFDDVFCYAPVAAVVEPCSAVLGRDYAQSAKDFGRQKRCCNSEKTLSVVGTDRVSFGVKVRYSAHTPIRRQYLYIAPRKAK